MSREDTMNSAKIKTPPAAMRRGPGSHMGGGKVEKAKDFKGTLKLLINYLAPYKVSILVVLFFAILGTIFSIVSPKILGNITTQIVSDYSEILIYENVNKNLPENSTIPKGTTFGQLVEMLPPGMLSKIPEDKIEEFKDLDLSVKPKIDLEFVQNTLIMLIGLYILSMLFTYIQGWVMSGISQKVSYELRKKILAKMSKLPLKYFDNTSHGDVLSRMTNDVDTLGQSLNQSLTQIVSSVITILGILIMMISISPLMTLIAILVLPISIVSVSFIIKKSQNLFTRQQNSLGELNGHIEEMYGGHTIVKAFNREDESLEKFDAINTKLYDSAWKSQFLSGLMFPIMNIIGNFGYVAISVLGGWLAIKKTLSIGDIQAFIQYMQQFTRPITQTANMSNVLQSTVASAERVFEFLDEDEEISDGKLTIKAKDVKGSIVFDNVHFSYAKGKEVITNFTAEIKPGERVALVGPTGAGKTTMVNLLMRFYDVSSGSIRIDGNDIRDIRRHSLRGLFGMVLQDTWLFNGTIRENIMYNSNNATEEDMIAAAQSAHADHFIRSLPNGYDMLINEEADNISQGEKQLITIARAMLADSPMLILDEATSSVDTRTEQLIQNAMDKLMSDRTTFIIAHRLSTIKSADLILFMKDGNIVEQGKHEELLAKKGFYAELYESQFKK